MSEQSRITKHFATAVSISLYLYILPYALADILGRVAHGLLVSDSLKG